MGSLVVGGWFSSVCLSHACARGEAAAARRMVRVTWAGAYMQASNAWRRKHHCPSFFLRDPLGMAYESLVILLLRRQAGSGRFVACSEQIQESVFLV